jgi:hypothetical protein
MSFSVTKNASAATDVKVLLSSLGFEPSSESLELVIDEFEQWRNTTRGVAYVPACVNTSMQIAA